MTNHCGRRIVIDAGFEEAICDVSRAIREEGLQMMARIDIRDHFWRDLGHDFRHYFLIEAWSPELALEALCHNLDVATLLPTTFAIYELADGETAVVARPPLSSKADQDACRRDAPELADIADRERERVARVLARLQVSSPRRGSIVPAA
jgi:uncharacterized protein (DUF302 family)